MFLQITDAGLVEGWPMGCRTLTLSMLETGVNLKLNMLAYASD